MMPAAAQTQAVPRKDAQPREGLAQCYDLWMVGAALLLILLGVVMVASASVAIAERQFGEPLHYFWRQLFNVTLGTAIAVAAVAVPSRLWRENGAWLLFLGFMLLVLVLIPGVGREVNGSLRWLRMGPVNLQPSEFMKLFVVVYLAGYLVRRGEEVRSVWSGFFKPIVVLALVAALLLLEPDYGATVVLFATALGMLFLSGVPLVSFFAWMTTIGGILGAMVLTAPYRVERLTTFLDPWADPFGSGFQLTQALIAIGRGDWFGVGLGNGVQKLFYLPEAHTDFVFAVLAEELGLAGMILVIGTVTFIAWRAFAIAGRANAEGQPFGAYLAYGIGLLMGLQAFINIGVNMGVLPTKGLALPLMSYGGSSMLANCLAVGILIRVDHELRVR